MNSVDVLEKMPSGADRVTQWFSELNDAQFDAVCASAITLTIEDHQRESGFISVSGVAKMVVAMRDRYRAMGAAGKAPRFCSHNLTDLQWRVIRRITILRGRPAADKWGLKRDEVMKIFGLSDYAYKEARAAA